MSGLATLMMNDQTTNREQVSVTPLGDSSAPKLVLSEDGEERRSKYGGTSSTAGAAFNILCTVLGTGLLQLPYGVKQSGWLGIPLLAIMGIAAGYTASAIGKSFKILEARQSSTRTVLGGSSLGSSTVDEALLDATPAVATPPSYGDLGFVTFGNFGRNFVNVQMHVTLLMVATIYHLLAALNVHWLFCISQPESALLIAAVVWFHVFLKSLGEVAILSYCARASHRHAQHSSQG